MAENNYEVLYVDKFDDMLEAASVREGLRKTFGLHHHHMVMMCSGDPVIIKKQVGLAEAERYKQAVQKVGGVAWVQELGPKGQHIERRQHNRRTLLDRRSVYRASSIIPDRRQSTGRRSTDRRGFH